jgi:hypothetical protein
VSTRRGGQDAEVRREVAREFLAAALYLAIVLLAVLVLAPDERLPDRWDLVLTLVGSSAGLVLAHWYAFRLASHLAEGGWRSPTAVKEAGGQLAGGVSVALVACLPFLFLDEQAAIVTAVVVLAALPALTGLAIARLRGHSWTVSLVHAALVLGVCYLVVLVKVAGE